MKTKVKRRRHILWTPEEFKALLKLNLLEFIHQPADRRLIKSFPTIDELRRLRCTSLLEKHQRACFLKWTGVPDDMWGKPLWKECMILRYRRGDVKAFALLPPRVGKLLDTAADEFRSAATWSAPPTEELFERVKKLYSFPYSGPGFEMLVSEYLDAQLKHSLTDAHPLRKPVSQSGLFNRIFEQSERASAPHRMPADKKSQFLYYLTIPKGHPEELIGVVLYHLIDLGWIFKKKNPGEKPPLLADVWPELYDIDQIQPNRDFLYIASRYHVMLRVPENFFTRLVIVYHILNTKSFLQKRTPTHTTVFWASRITEAMRPDVYGTYLEWVRFFRRRVLKLLLDNKIKPRDESLYEALIGPFKDALRHYPLLNSVFHSEVHSGHEQLRHLARPGRPDNRAEGLAIVYAVRQMRQFGSTRRKHRVEDVLDKEKLSHTVGKTLKDCTGSGLYQFMTPLVAALTQAKDIVYTPQIIKETYRIYRENPELDTTVANLNLPD